MHKVIFIRPLGDLNEANFSLTNIPEPLSLEYFQAILEQIDIESSIYYGKIDEDKLFQELLSDSIIAIGFSVYTYQYKYSLELSKRVKSFYKEQNQKTPVIIFGGYHPSALPEIVIKEKAIDIVVKGEGEFVLPEIMKCLIQNECLSKVNGIWYKDNSGTVIKTNNRERNTDLDNIPLPKRDMKFLSSSNQYQIIYPPISQQKSVAQVMYSRGCSFSCVYCTATNIWGKKMDWRNPKKVLDEIECLYNEYGTNLILFPDLTFNFDKKKVLDICNEFTKKDLPVNWSAFFRLDRLDDEILYAIKEAKCVKMHIGIETDSINADNLKGDYTISNEECHKILNKANEIGLLTRGFFIIGFPTDTTEKIKNYNNFLRYVHIDEIIVSFITPFPGTKIWSEYSQYYLPKNYDFNEFTVNIPVINHPTLSKQELLDLKMEVVRNFYSDRVYQERISKKIDRFPHLKNSYLEYFAFLENCGVFEKSQLTNIFKVAL